MASKGYIEMILVTGASGFVGKYVVKRLINNHELRCIVRDKRKFSLSHKNLDVIEGDLLHPDFLESCFKDVDKVVHLAAIIKPSDKKIESVNVGVTRQLVNLAMKYKTRYFIFFSSDNVLSRRKDLYGQTKEEAEKYIKKMNNYIIFRPCTIYGRGDRINIATIISSVKKYPLIPIPGDGKSKMQPIYVEDVVSYVENALEYMPMGEFTLAGKSEVSLNDLIDLIGRNLDKRVYKIHIPLPLAKAMVKVSERLFSSRLMTYTQLIHINEDHVYDISETIRILRHTPLSITEGLKLTIKDHE